MARATAAELRALFRTALEARLAPHGWRRVDGLGDSVVLAAFERPLDPEFSATAEVLRRFSMPDHPPVGIIRLSVGVAYEPLDRLWPLLTDDPASAALSDGVPGGPDNESPLEIGNVAEVARAAETLASLILEHSDTFAERYRDVDALIAEYRHDDSWSTSTMVPALLAAAGRLDEATEALDTYRPEAEDEDRGTKRFRRQLRRWIDSGADPALLPRDPPARRRPPERLSREEHRR